MAEGTGLVQKFLVVLRGDADDIVCVAVAAGAVADIAGLHVAAHFLHQVGEGLVGGLKVQCLHFKAGGADQLLAGNHGPAVSGRLRHAHLHVCAVVVFLRHGSRSGRGGGSGGFFHLCAAGRKGQEQQRRRGQGKESLFHPFVLLYP